MYPVYYVRKALKKLFEIEWIFYAGEEGPLNGLYRGLSRSIVQTNQPEDRIGSRYTPTSICLFVYGSMTRSIALHILSPGLTAPAQ